MIFIILSYKENRAPSHAKNIQVLKRMKPELRSNKIWFFYWKKVLVYFGERSFWKKSIKPFVLQIIISTEFCIFATNLLTNYWHLHAWRSYIWLVDKHYVQQSCIFCINILIIFLRFPLLSFKKTVKHNKHNKD